jgi:nitronate monooxygenase
MDWLPLYGLYHFNYNYTNINKCLNRQKEDVVKELTFESFQRLLHSLKIKLPSFDIPPLTIGNITSRLSIVQGGMGVGISLSSLASAVAGQGGIGVIAANGIGMIDPDYFSDGRGANVRALRSEIKKARAKGSGVIGVNIMVALEDYQALLEVAIDERVDMVFLGAGLPIKHMPVEKLRNAGVKVVPIVSTARAASLIFSMWNRMYQDVPDAVVVEGPKAGGHLGVAVEDLEDDRFSLETAVPQVKEALAPYVQQFDRSIPIIAGGGIFTGEDIYNIMKLGADAVQMGTRFAATEECDAEIRFKQAIVDCSQKDIGIIKSPVGLPGRAIINDFLTSTTVKKRKFSCPWKCLSGCQAENSNYCISMALNQARKGDLAHGFVFIGSNGYRVASIMTVSSLLSELRQQYAAALFTDKRHVLEAVIGWVANRKNEYVAAEQRLKELHKYIEHFSLSDQVDTVRAELKHTNDRLKQIRASIEKRLEKLLNTGLSAIPS